VVSTKKSSLPSCRDLSFDSRKYSCTMTDLTVFSNFLRTKTVRR
jgi:hypothetical protein